MERPPSRRRAALRQILPLAGLAALVEGLAIVRYDLFGASFEIESLATALAVPLAVVAVHLALWSVPALALSGWLSVANTARVCITFWAVAVVASRWLLQDRLIGWAWWLPPTAMTLTWIASPLLGRRESATGARSAEGAAVALLAAFSLAGRVPDFSHTDATIVLFLATTAVLAAGVLVSLRRWPLSTAAALVLTMALAALVSRPEVAAPREAPNVLFVLVDTLRRDHVQPFGDRVETPAIARLASQGVTFLDAVTPVPKTPASVASFWTGDYPVAHGVRALTDHLPTERRTVVEAFSDAGYATRAFVNNAWLSQGRGFGQGFERFSGYFEVNRPYGAFRYLSWAVLADQLTVRRIQPFRSQTSARRLTDAVVEYLERRDPARPFFAYVHYFEPHWPYFPPPDIARRHGAPEDGRSTVNFIDQSRWSRGQMIFDNPLPERDNEIARRQYRAEVDSTLRQVGRLIDALDERELGERTIVVFTSDHGHALGEHDYYYHHGEFLYDDSMRIPLVLRWSGRLPRGLAIDSQVRSIDVAPTLVRLAGIEGFAAGRGDDLSPLWEGAESASRAVLLESDVAMFAANRRRPLRGVAGKLRGLRDGRHKLILHPLPDGLALELYDLVEDPGELRNLASSPEMRPVVQRLLADVMEQIPPSEARRLMGGGRHPDAEPDQEIDEAEAEMLRSLGYVQ